MSRPHKPRDVGNGIVCASFGRGGEWLSLATVDQDVGFVELTGMPPFDPAWRGDVDAVRRYRSWMCLERHAFLRVEADDALLTTHEEAPDGTRRMIQHVVARVRDGRHPSRVRIVVQGRLARPALAEITETDPPDPEDTPTRIEASHDRLLVQGVGSPVVVEAAVHDGFGRRLPWRSPSTTPPMAEAWLGWPDDADELRLDISCAFSLPVPSSPPWLPPGRDDRRPGAAPTHDRARPIRPSRRHATRVSRVARRAITYARGCTSLLVAPGERCILTDHRTLPLSWTRDAWWQARLLLASWSRGGPAEDLRIVGDHLRWLFLRCERPDGQWVRSHHADGRRKDLPFQADQQLYPLLELADHVMVAGGPPALPPSRSWAALVGEAWAAVERAIDPVSGLIATAENAADDPAGLPYLVSHQVLLWHTAARLAGVAARLDLAGDPFAKVADEARAAVGDGFVVKGQLGPQWAYAIDGRGGAERYMDANDLPVAMAPLWGFCAPDDQVWRSTLRFAFDVANPGYSPGPAGGLGSRHTPGTWTLGDLMGLVGFSVMDDRPAADAALGRLMSVAFGDGMLPEAYDSGGVGEALRHWFAWPGAAFAVTLLEHGRHPPRSRVGWPRFSGSRPSGRRDRRRPPRPATRAATRPRRR